MARGLGDHNAAWLGEPLQSRGQVRGLTDDRTLAGFAFSNQFADDHQAGCDADASGKRCTSGLGKGRDRLSHPHAGANGTLRLVFMGPRPAEIREHAVAQELGDVAFEPGDLACHGVVVGLHEVMHLLRVAPRGERGRADQIDKHDGELPTVRIRRECYLPLYRRRASLNRDGSMR